MCCRRLVLAVSAAPAGRLLAELVPEAAGELESVLSASLVVMNLGYRRESIAHPLDGFGFLVPRTERNCPLMGVLWADSIFPHHAPPGYRLLRVFVGGARDPEAVHRSDARLLETVREPLRETLGVRGEPVLIDIRRHVEAIPQYGIGYRHRVARIRKAVGTVPGLHLVGNYLDGVSLNDCVRVARRCAAEILDEIGGEEAQEEPSGRAHMPAGNVAV
ncbi:MAG: protoporphyrinogen oxidase [Planctomycetota bacterium]|nr:MAG: protoporphyrinogen oxidase [Planctomycetota bacterium]